MVKLVLRLFDYLFLDFLQFVVATFVVGGGGDAAAHVITFGSAIFVVVVFVVVDDDAVEMWCGQSVHCCHCNLHFDVVFVSILVGYLSQ